MEKLSPAIRGRLEKSSSWGNAAWAEAILARNLLGEDKLTDAEVAASKAIDYSRREAGQDPRYEAAIADARVKAETGKTGEATHELNDMLASTHNLGYRLYEYQARLALAETETESSSPSALASAAALEKRRERTAHSSSPIRPRRFYGSPQTSEVISSYLDRRDVFGIPRKVRLLSLLQFLVSSMRDSYGLPRLRTSSPAITYCPVGLHGLAKSGPSLSLGSQ